MSEINETCAHCLGPIAIRNPTGNCDHLHYPEYCKICSDSRRFEIRKEGIRLAKEWNSKAASLDLIEALDWLVTMSSIVRRHLPDTSETEVFINAIDKARAAIAKANGGVER